MGTAIPDFWAGGHRCQDFRDIIQGGGSSGSPVQIGYMGHDPVHMQDNWGF